MKLGNGRGNGRTVPVASAADTAGIVARVVLPVLAKGVIIRRPAMVAMADRLNLDSAAVATMQRMRDKYGEGPLLLKTPFGLKRSVILAPDHVHRVLQESPEPFATAAAEKRAALAHFEPQVSLVSHGKERGPRRQLNEQALQTERRVHQEAAAFADAASDAVAEMRLAAGPGRELGWHAYTRAFAAMARRIALGSAAWGDEELTQLLNRLRGKANWAFLQPVRKGDFEAFHRRVREHLDRAEPGSLAALVVAAPAGHASPTHQIAHWLFAFDAAAIATFRALALLATHPEQARRAREELSATGWPAQPDLPYLRASVLESLRLWPTTPIVLRQSTTETEWATGALPAGTGIVIFAPFFHRDDARVEFAHRFAPEIWLDDASRGDQPFIPFSAGPVECAGKNLVLLVTSAALAAFLSRTRLSLASRGMLDPQRPLPGTLNHFALRFGLG